MLTPTRSAAALGIAPSDYPFASHWFHTPEGRLHYVDEGQGPAVVFVHGTPTWSYLWRQQIQALRGKWRCIAVDHLGYGLSDKPRDGDYVPEDHARRLGALLDHLGVQEFVLVGHDFGGPIGLAAALERLPNLRGVALLNTWCWDLRDNPQARWMAVLLASPLGAFLYRWLNASPRWLVPMAFAVRSRLTPAIHHAYLAPFPARHDREAPLAAGRALLSPWYSTVEAGLGALRRLPTLLAWGLKDPAFGSALPRWRDLLPGAEVHTWDDAGHFPQEERGDEVAAALSTFLRERVTWNPASHPSSQRRAG